VDQSERARRSAPRDHGHSGKTGLVYTLDAATGKFLWARETTPQNVISDINKESGAATVNPDKEFTAPARKS